jgi:hypothetical protein
MTAFDRPLTDQERDFLFDLAASTLADEFNRTQTDRPPALRTRRPLFSTDSRLKGSLRSSVTPKTPTSTPTATFWWKPNATGWRSMRNTPA